MTRSAFTASRNLKGESLIKKIIKYYEKENNLASVNFQPKKTFKLRQEKTD